jgi:hypothetical protein
LDELATMHDLLLKKGRGFIDGRRHCSIRAAIRQTLHAWLHGDESRCPRGVDDEQRERRDEVGVSIF